MIYCTRARIHVDRSASAWLIRRFIDPQAEFVFVTDPLTSLRSQQGLSGTRW